jgi:hypothetical protein
MRVELQACTSATESNKWVIRKNNISIIFAMIFRKRLWCNSIIIIGLFFSLSQNALATDIRSVCEKNDIQVTEKNNHLVLRLEDFQFVDFITGPECELGKVCQYKIVARSGTYERIVAERAEISNICDAFRVSERKSRNPFFGIKSSRAIMLYPFITTFRYEIDLSRGSPKLDYMVFERTLYRHDLNHVELSFVENHVDGTSASFFHLAEQSYRLIFSW